jgi:hypothetical protein
MAVGLLIATGGNAPVASLLSQISGRSEAAGGSASNEDVGTSEGHLLRGTIPFVDAEVQVWAQGWA